MSVQIEEVQQEWRIGFKMTQGLGEVESSTLVVAPKTMSRKEIRKRFLKIISKEGSVKLTNKMIAVGTVYVVGNANP